MLIDPHTAVGVGAAQRARSFIHGPIVTMATAHPAKFPDAVEQATGIRPQLPDHLADILVRPEYITELPNDLAVVQQFIEQRAHR
jgi:threonine synthase